MGAVRSKRLAQSGLSEPASLSGRAYVAGCGSIGDAYMRSRTRGVAALLTMRV